jgi:hypothetical protein
MRFLIDAQLPPALGGDPGAGAEERVAAKVLVPILHKTEAGFVPDKAVVEQVSNSRFRGNDLRGFSTAVS